MKSEQKSGSKTKPRSKGVKEGVSMTKGAQDTYVLKLYVTGVTPKSIRAINNMKAICEEHLKGRYKLEVIDVYQHPALASGEQIVAVPTLVKQLPLPLRRLVGDLSEKDRVLFGLDIHPED